MKTLLVSANTERINMVSMPLGLGLVAAATRRAGHGVVMIDLLGASEPLSAVRSAIAEVQPDVIGISVRNIDDQCQTGPRFLLEQVKGVTDECRSFSQAPIVLGGAGYSIFPVEALALLGADFGVWGDGEKAFPALLERLSGGHDPRGIPGIVVPGEASSAARTSSKDLDALPLWDDALFQSADPADPDLWVPVQSRRGCPNDCSYCSTARIQGRTIRARSPRLVVQEISQLAQRGFRRFFFVDNSFNIPESHALELCRLLEDVSPAVEWRCILYPEQVSAQLAEAMARSGCVEVSMGFESGCQRILRELGKRFTPDEVRRVSDLLRDHGIRRMGFLLLGGTGETRESVEESLAFAQSLRLEGLRITVGIRIYPGTPLARRALAEGVITSEAALLAPQFYLAPGLAPWIHERIAQLQGGRA